MIRVRTCTNRIKEFPYDRLGIFCPQGYSQLKIDRASLTARNSPPPPGPTGRNLVGPFPCYIPASSRFLLLCSPLCPALSLGCHKLKADMLFDQPEEMTLRNLIFHADAVEQCFLTRMLPHHRTRTAPEN